MEASAPTPGEAVAPSTPAAARRIVVFPAVRGAIAIAFVVGAVLAVQTIAKALPIPKTAGLIVTTVFGIPAILLALRAHARWIERRVPMEISGAGAVVELGAGAVLGALLFAIVAGVLAVLGAYRVFGTNPASVMVVPLFSSLLAAFFEEALFRGIIYRIAEEALGSWLALVVSALLFGAVHLMNPNADWWGGMSIVIEAGILLAASYLLTRRLWVPIGLHFAWNFTESGVFGVVISGNATTGWLRSTLSGPKWLSGGAFGAEASVVAIVLCLAVALVFIGLAIRRGRVVPPPWRRAKRAAVA